MLFLGGITTMVTFTALCFVVGVYMLVCGIAVGVLEAPILFYCCDLTKKFAPKVDLVTPLYRAIAYALYVWVLVVVVVVVVVVAVVVVVVVVVRG